MYYLYEIKKCKFEEIKKNSNKKRVKQWKDASKSFSFFFLSPSFYLFNIYLFFIKRLKNIIIKGTQKKTEGREFGGGRPFLTFLFNTSSFYSAFI